MKKLLYLLFLLPAIALADSPLLVEIDNFDGGVDTAHLADKQRTSNLIDCLNFLSDRKYGLTRRDGTARGPGCLYTSTLKLWRYIAPSGNEWLIRLDCRGNLIAGKQLNSSGACFSVCVSTTFLLSTTQITDAAEGLGKVWFTNKTNGLMSWDETNFVTYSNAPNAARIKIYKNRVILADVSNEQSSIRLSGELNGGDWNNDSRFSTSPVSIRVGGVNDGNKVYWIHVGLDELLIGKAFSLYRLLGNDQRDFRLGVVSPEIGSIYPNTIAQKAQRTFMLSNRGLDAYTPPYTFEKIGEPIKDRLEALSSLTTQARAFTFDSQGQWQLGASTPIGNISTTLIPGAIGPMNLTQQDTDNVGWSQSTVTANANTISFTEVPGYITYRSTVGFSQIPNQGFEFQRGPSGALNNTALFWTTSTDHVGFAGEGWVHPQGSALAKEGTSYMKIDSVDSVGGVGQNVGVTAFVMDNASNVLVSMPVNPAITQSPTQTYEYFRLDTHLISGTTGFLGFGATYFLNSLQGVAAATFYLETPIQISTSVNFWAAYKNVPSTTRSFYIDAISTPTPRDPNDFRASVHSRVFNTQVSSPNFDPFLADPSSASVVFTVETSTASNCCWNAPVTVTTGNIPAVTSAQYAIYNASFTATTSTIIYISSVTLGSWVTGYFQTGVVDVGPDITSWGLFTADQSLNGGGITHQVQSSVDGTFTDGGWVTQSLNTTIGVPVRRFIAARPIFAASISTHTPSINSLTFNWNNGESPPDPTSVTFKESYYLFFSTATNASAKNDQIAVVNRNNAVDLDGGLNVSGAIVYNNSLVVGDADQTGYVYVMFASTDGSDFNNNVRSYAKFRKLDGGQPDAIKTYDRIYITLSRDKVDVSQIFSIEYSLDGSTTTYSAANVELSTGTYSDVMMSYFSKNLPHEGHYITIKVSEVTQRMYPYNIHRMRLYGIIKEVE